jgi:hypothetical protein
VGAGRGGARGETRGRPRSPRGALRRIMQVPARCARLKPSPLPLRPIPVTQVTLLASGRLMYHGPREGITPWFGSLGYKYDPSLHGVPSDWWVAAGLTGGREGEARDRQQGPGWRLSESGGAWGVP